VSVDGSLGLRLQPDPARWTLPRFLADVAARHGPRPALRFEGRTWSYAELAGEAQRLARGLLAGGVAAGAHVGLLAANRPEWVIGAFAAASVGAVVVPLSTLATHEERDWVLRHSGVSTLLLQRSLRGRDFLAELTRAHPELLAATPGRILCPALPQLRRVAVTGGEAPGGGVVRWDELVALGEAVPDALLAAAADDVAPGYDGLLIYTSGTTERPKGVLHRQRAAVIQSWRFAEWLGLGTDDRVFTAQPFFWSAGIAMSLGATLAAGACLVLQETFEAAGALELVERERATVVHAFPHQEQALGEQPGLAQRDLRALRKTRFSSPLARQAGIEEDVWGIDASYGLSETFTLVSTLPTDAPAAQRRASSGRPLPGTEIAILDPESGARLPAGAPGEIAVRGATLMRGYHRVPPESVLDADGWLRTGDAGWLDDEGLLHWTGRMSGMIKTGGANVSPVELERTLAGYPGLQVAVPLGVPHPTLGEALVLCVVPTDGARAPDEAAIRAFLRERVAPYKVPRRVLVFGRGDVALTQNQKVQVAPLREAALARLAAEGAEIAGHRY
jgi:acyl-CoA synthetase (AMP-forming)/AMP-acid ligase II